MEGGACVGRAVAGWTGANDGESSDGVKVGAAGRGVNGTCSGYPTGLAHSGGCIGTHTWNGKLPVWMHTDPGSQQSDDALHFEV